MDPIPSNAVIRQRRRDAALQRRQSRLEGSHAYDAEVWLNLLIECFQYEDDERDERYAEEAVALALGNAHALELGAPTFVFRCSDGEARVGAVPIGPWLGTRAVMLAMTCRGGLAFQSLADHLEVLTKSPAQEAERFDVHATNALVAAATRDATGLSDAMDALRAMLRSDPTQAARHFFASGPEEPEQAARELFALLANVSVVDVDLPAGAYATGNPPLRNPKLIRFLAALRRYRRQGPERVVVASEPRAIVTAGPRGLRNQAELAGFMVVHRLLQPRKGPSRDGARYFFASPDGLCTVELQSCSPGEGARSLLDPGELLAVADMWSREVDGTPPSDPGARERMAQLLSLARSAIDLVIEHADPESGKVPPRAFTSALGKRMLRAEPGRFELDRLRAVQRTYAAIFEEYGETSAPARPMPPKPSDLVAIDKQSMEMNSSVLLFGPGATALAEAMAGAAPGPAEELFYARIVMSIRNWQLAIHVYALDHQRDAALGLAPSVDGVLAVHSQGKPPNAVVEIASAGRRAGALLGTVGPPALADAIAEAAGDVDFQLAYDLASARDALKPLVRIVLQRARG